VLELNHLADGLAIDSELRCPEITGMPKIILESKRRVDPDALVLSPPPPHGRATPLTKSQLCEWLGCSPKYIESQVAQGLLRPHRLSNRMVRFTWSEIDKWMSTKIV
jgi:predicted DNA-binding transcriptional regulator AlpA